VAQAASLPFFAVTPSKLEGGRATFTLGTDTTWEILAVSFTMNLGGTAAVCNPVVLWRADAATVLYAQSLGTALGGSATMLYTASAYGDPCGLGQTSAGNLTPDTIPRLTLVDGCSVVCEADDSTTGALVTAAKIQGATIYVSDQGSSGLRAGIPLYSFTPPGDSVAA